MKTRTGELKIAASNWSSSVQPVRLLAISAVVLLVGCSTVPTPAGPSKSDPAKEAWYSRTVEQLTAMNREAEDLLRSGKSAEGADIITAAQPLMRRVLSVSQPTLAAMEVSSDLDDLYGRMLLANRHYGWARLLFQKNLARWKNWAPQTPETARRVKLAQSRIADCDSRLAK
jgi:hypothetical protein